VDADVGPFGTRQDLSPDRVRLAATAGQGGDAKIRIQASIGLFNQKKIDDIDIVIRNQALANLNTFLVPDDGIELSGFLRSANISIRVRKEQLSEQMVLDYDGLKVKYLADHERNGVVALFKSALSSALLHKEKSADGSQGAPAVEFKLAQEPTYGIFKFLLQGLTEGAQMVAKQG
jgi:hypothetical protein